MKPREAASRLTFQFGDGEVTATCSVTVSTKEILNADVTRDLKRKMWEELYGDLYRMVRDLREGTHSSLGRKIKLTDIEELLKPPEA